MGRYLDVVNNQCQTRTPADVDVCRTGAAVKPNENYARELLQLFSIGVDLLNADGSAVRDAAEGRLRRTLRTRFEDFSRVFTGWILAPQFGAGIPNYADPMRASQGARSRTQYLLTHSHTRRTVGRRGTASRSRQHRGASERRSVHLQAADSTSRDEQSQFELRPGYRRRLRRHNRFTNPVAGGCPRHRAAPRCPRRGQARFQLRPIREPVLFMTGLLRALNGSTDGALNSVVVGQAQIGSSQMSQNVFNAPSVFNFYPFEHEVAGTDPPTLGRSSKFTPPRPPYAGPISSIRSSFRRYRARRLISHRSVTLASDPQSCRESTTSCCIAPCRPTCGRSTEAIAGVPESEPMFASSRLSISSQLILRSAGAMR